MSEMILLAFDWCHYWNRRHLEFSDDTRDHAQNLSSRRRVRSRDRRRKVVGTFLNRADDHGVAIVESSNMAARLHWRFAVDDQIVPAGNIQRGECVAFNLQTGDISAFEHG